jgi:transketolase
VYLKLYIVDMDAVTTYSYADLPALMNRMTGDEKHSAAATSTLDVLWVLYDSVLQVRPNEMDHANRDRFYLSKGHGPMAFYSVLAAKGFFPADWLDSWAGYNSPLGMHPDRLLVPGVEVGSGSLGHGLPLAVGAALGMRAKRDRGRVFVLLGDAELDEGSNHEAIAAAPPLGLDNLTAIVIDNQSTSLGWPGGIASRFSVNGWSTADVDGRSHDAVRTAIGERADQPHAVVAHV